MLTGWSVIGGPHAGNFIKGKFSLFADNYWNGKKHVVDSPLAFGKLLKEFTEEEFALYLDLYNIQLVLSPDPVTIQLLNQFHKILKPRDFIGKHQVWEFWSEPSWFYKGSGELSFDYDTIQIKNASPGKIIVKFHWVKSLKSTPPLTLTPVYLRNDPVPFIQIDNNIGTKRINIINQGV